MAEEIKISIHKKDLTYYIISVFIILGALCTGYLFGAQKNTSPQSKITQTALMRRVPENYLTNEDSFSENNTNPSPGNGGAGGAVSDKSWSNTTSSSRGQSSLSSGTVNTYKYFTSTNNTTENLGSESSTEAETSEDSDGYAFLASKNGTKYYPVGCKSADRIKSENRIYFDSAEEAELEGLTPTTTCK